MEDSGKARELVPPSRATTPPSIFLALLMFAFVVATPFLADIDARDAKGDGGWATLRVMLGWMLAGGIATIVGIVCTVVGARRSPRSAWTALAIFIAFFASVAVLYFVLRMLA